MDFSYRPTALRAVWDIQNRKGKLPVGLLPEVTTLQDQQREIRKKLRQPGLTETAIAALREDLATAAAATEERLQTEIIGVSESLLARSETSTFEWGLRVLRSKGSRTLFTTHKSAATYFADKLLQQAIEQRLVTLGRGQSSRADIVASIQTTLCSRLPMALVKLDIKDYYATIDHDILIRQLQITGLRPSAIRLLEKLLREFEAITGSRRGIPTGVGVSAKLAELYLHELDSVVRTTQDVTYYARFVDDIFIAISLKNPTDDRGDAVRDATIRQIQNLGLGIHPTKSTYDIAHKAQTFKPFEHLGYRFEAQKSGAIVGPSAATLDKIRNRITRTLDVWDKSDQTADKNRHLLMSRLRYITGNTRLLNNKRNALIGVRYSQPHVNDVECWRKLDRYLEKRLSKSQIPQDLSGQIQNLSFLDGFENRRMHRFTARDFKAMRGAWNA